MLPVFVVAIATSAIPQYNVNRTCHMDTYAVQGIVSYQACLREEGAAKAKVAQEWSRYPAATRQACASEEHGNRGRLESYVELMVCFELRHWNMQFNDVGGSFAADSQSYGGSR